MSIARLAAPALVAALSLFAHPAGAAPVAVTGDPVAPLPSQAGTGLCMTEAVSTNPVVDFPQSGASLVSAINAFLDGHSTRTTRVIGTALDLGTSSAASAGDFTGPPACPANGCPFAVGNLATAFAGRLRGYLAISPAQVGKALHLGAVADDAVAITLFDLALTAYPVFARAPTLGFPAWRITNEVTFAKPGLYPIEIAYAQVSDHAMLEVALLEGSFVDFERPVNQAPIVRLDDSGFAPLAPAILYQSSTGEPSAAGPSSCAQCTRAHAGSPGSAGCADGSHCNEAALCVPCNERTHCGAACVACADGESCVEGQCVQPSSDAGTGDAGTGDAAAPPPPAGTGSSTSEGAPPPGEPPPTARGDGGCDCSSAPGRSAGLLGFVLAGLTIAGTSVRRRRSSRSTAASASASSSASPDMRR